MYQSLQLEVLMMMQYVRRGDETAVVKLHEQNADPVAQEPSPETAERVKDSNHTNSDLHSFI